MFKELLSTPTARLGKAGKFTVFQIKLWSHCARLLKKNRAGQQAAALAYHTIFGIVPLAIVMLMIFQSLPAYSGIGDKITEFVYDQMNLSTIKYPDPANPEETIKLTGQIDKVVGRFFAATNKGTVTIFGVVIIIWAALGLLSTIERAFNNIWRVSKPRGVLQRTINYWALLTLGPLLLGVGIYVSAKAAFISEIHQTILSNAGPAVLSYLVSLVMFFLMYFILPNTRVNVKSALWGSAVAALVWLFAKWAFSAYVTGVIPYSKVYGVLGLIPLTVLWIYVSWLIVLFGLQLTFTSQHIKTLDAAEISKAKKNEDFFIADDVTAINIMREIARGFAKRQAPVSNEVISSRLNIPAELTDKIVAALAAEGFLVKTSEPQEGLMPAREPQDINLANISSSISKYCFAKQPGDADGQIKDIMNQRTELLANYNLRQISAE
jgi:YihY family inner membrane protein